MRYSKLALWSWLAIALTIVGGCNQPKCREVSPIEEVEEEMTDSAEDLLDDVDATEVQTKAVLSIVRELIPKYDAMRRATQPKTIAFIRELQKNRPSQARLSALFEELLSELHGFSYELVDALVAGHRILTPAQRQEILKKQNKPKKPFKGSWLLDRSLGILLWEIDATREQEELTVALKDALIRRSQPLQKKLEHARRKMIAELGKENPSVEALRAHVDAFTQAPKEFVPQAIAYYLEWHAKLKPDQRTVINGYLKRFEPCEAFGDSAAQKSGD